MPARYLFRRRRRTPRLPMMLFGIFVVLAAVKPLRAQTAPPAAAVPAESPEKRAASLAESGRNFKAAQLYREALNGHQTRLAEHPDDAAFFLAWCSCRNGLAGQFVQLNQFRDALTLLADTLARLQAFVARHPDDAAARAELAVCWEQLASRSLGMGLGEESARHLRQATDVLRKLAGEPGATPERRAELARQLGWYAAGMMSLGRYPEATAAYEEALAVGRKLLDDYPDLPRALETLAGTYNAYALLVREAGQFSRAADMIREAIRLLTKLETLYPDHPEYWHQLPTCWRNLSQPLGYLNSANEVAMARREADRAEAKLARFPDAAKKWLGDGDKILSAVANADLPRLGGLGAEVGNNLQQAEADLRLYPDVPAFRVRVCSAKLALAMRLAASENPSEEEVLRVFGEALAESEKLVEQGPDVPKFRLFSGIIRMTFGLTLLGTGRSARGETEMERAVAECRKLADEYPGEPELRSKLTDTGVAVFTTAMSLRDWKCAARSLTVVREDLKKLAEAHPTCPRYRRSCAISANMLAQLRVAEGAEDGGESAFREGVALWRRMVADFPDNPDVRKSLGDALGNLAAALLQKGRHAELLPVLEEMLRIHEGLVQTFPTDPEYLVHVSSDHAFYADVLERQDRVAAALEHHARSVRSAEEAVKLNPRRRDWLAGLRTMHTRRAEAYLKLGNLAEYHAAQAAMKWIEEALDAPLIRLSRIDKRLTEGNRAAALREADDLYCNCDLTAAHLHELAVLYAREVGHGPPTPAGETCAARAVDALRRAAELGHVPYVAPEADPRFRPLSDRPDFRRLTAGQRQ